MLISSSISNPLPTKKIWFENAVFWDTGNPYIYGRTTAADRIIFGGGDEPFYNPRRREELLPKKTSELVAGFENGKEKQRCGDLFFCAKKDMNLQGKQNGFRRIYDRMTVR